MRPGRHDRADAGRRAAGRRRRSHATGGVGVLADNVLGYPVIASAPPDGWAVTTEMSIDVLGALPPAGTCLWAEAGLVAGDDSGGFAEGRVVDADGSVVALVRQRGRFVARPQDPRGVRRGAVASLPEIVPEVTREAVTLDLDVTSALANPLDNLHGGVSLWLVEGVGSEALRQQNQEVETASVHVTYLRAVPVGTCVRIVAEPRHAGRSLRLADVRAWLPDGRPCIEATVVGHVT